MYRIHMNASFFKYMLVFVMLTSWISGHTDAFRMISTKQAQSPRNNTLERCRKNRHCRKDLECSAFDFEGPPTPCTRSNATCYCLSSNRPLPCGADENDQVCPTGETCAQTLGGNLFCVGCKAFKTLSHRYKPISKGSCKGNNRPTPPSTPTPGRTGDFCSIVHKCASDLNCIDSKSELNCARFSTRCTCALKGNRLRPCTSSKDCKKGEVCARDMVEGDEHCFSCDAARSYFQLTLVDDDDPKCKAAWQGPPRLIPHFPESPDGYTLDTCRDQIECRGDLQCREFRAAKNCSRNSFLCVCQEDGNKFHSCEKSTECRKRRRGEVCATGLSTPLDNGPVCVSHIYDQENFPNEVVVRKPLPKYRTGSTGQSCSSELDCVQENMACTHPSEQYGGCAGRRGCTCQPIRRHVCGSNSDCPTGEVCVNIRDAKNRNYCKAKNTLDEPLEILVNEAKSTPTPTPTQTYKKQSQWLDQPCSTSDDCANPDNSIIRKCIHIMERYAECDGSRASCVCKAVEIKERKLKSVVAVCRNKSQCGEGESCVEYADTITVGKRTGFCSASVLVDGKEEEFTKIS